MIRASASAGRIAHGRRNSAKASQQPIATRRARLPRLQAPTSHFFTFACNGRNNGRASFVRAPAVLRAKATERGRWVPTNGGSEGLERQGRGRVISPTGASRGLLSLRACSIILALQH